jgi:hypothetical protein
MDAWISSRVLPLVSGTSRSTNTTVSPQMLAKMKNVPAFRPSHTQISIIRIQKLLQSHETAGINVYVGASMLHSDQNPIPLGAP